MLFLAVYMFRVLYWKIENSLLVRVVSHESCHSSMHSLDICEKKLSGGILLWVMTDRIPFWHGAHWSVAKAAENCFSTGLLSYIRCVYTGGVNQNRAGPSLGLLIHPCRSVRQGDPLSPLVLRGHALGPFPIRRPSGTSVGGRGACKSPGVRRRCGTRVVLSDSHEEVTVWVGVRYARGYCYCMLLWAG